MYKKEDHFKPNYVKHNTQVSINEHADLARKWGSLKSNSLEITMYLINKTPAKAFTPPAKRKWAQNQAGL